MDDQFEPFPPVANENMEQRALRVLDTLVPKHASRDSACEDLCLVYPNARDNRLKMIGAALHVLGPKR